MDQESFLDVLKRISRWCSERERSEFEVRVKLREFDLDEGEVDAIIEKLTKEDFLNEKRFAQAFAGGKFRINKWGRLLIRQGLISKGIRGDMLDVAMEAIHEDDYLQTLDTLLASKARGLKSLRDHERHAKLVRFAYSKGFEQELAYDSIHRQNL